MLNKFLHTVSNNLKIALNVGRGQMLAYTPTIRVRIPLKPTFFL